MTNPTKTYIERIIIGSFFVFIITISYNRLFGIPLDGLPKYLIIVPVAIWAAHPFYPAAKRSFLKLKSRFVSMRGNDNAEA